MLTKPTTINRADLMRLAWTMARQDLWATRVPASALRALFPAALRRAWATMKMMAAHAARQAAQSVAFLRAQAEDLENTDRLGLAGIARLDATRRALGAARGRA